MLRVKLLEEGARLPVVAHPGEDLGYDLFALEAATLAPRATVKVRTGIAVEARHPATGAPLGLLVRVCGVCFAAVALRFNIILQTNESARRFRNQSLKPPRISGF